MDYPSLLGRPNAFGLALPSSAAARLNLRPCFRRNCFPLCPPCFGFLFTLPKSNYRLCPGLPFASGSGFPLFPLPNPLHSRQPPDLHPRRPPGFICVIRPTFYLHSAFQHNRYRFSLFGRPTTSGPALPSIAAARQNLPAICCQNSALIRCMFSFGRPNASGLALPTFAAARHGPQARAFPLTPTTPRPHGRSPRTAAPTLHNVRNPAGSPPATAPQMPASSGFFAA